MTDTPKPIGRPPLPFSQDIANEVCDRLIMGESLRTICKDAHIPDAVTISKWLANNPAFVTQYAHAREAYADSEFEKIQEIADDDSNDWVERQHFAGDDKSPQLNGEAVARSRLRIDAIKWRIGKLKPKKYGEKLGVEQTVSVAPDLMSLMKRVAEQGQRLTPETEDVDDGDAQS